MRYKSPWTGIAASVVFISGFAGSASEAAVLYNSDFTQVKSTLNISGTSSTYHAIGDDYNTGASSITVTGMSFYGGVDSSLTNTQVEISFYDASGNKIQTVRPGKSETSGTNTVHTIAASDFNLNGATGLTLPGAGYVVFDAVSYGGGYIDQNGNFVPIAADFNPAVQLGSGIAPTVGTNNAASAALVDNNGVLSTPTVFSVDGTPANQSQYALFSLTGTAVPEPASLGLILPATLFLARRRHARA